jgi:hypothetical protein
MKPVGTRKFGSAGCALGPGTGVAVGTAVGCGVGVGAGLAVGTGEGVTVPPPVPTPGPGTCWLTIGCALVAPPPLHAASAQASNVAPASERTRR